MLGAQVDFCWRFPCEPFEFRRLRRDGLFFVGIDVIGGRLTEVNVTSPTGIQEMGRLDGVAYEKRVLDRVEGTVLES